MAEQSIRSRKAAAQAVKRMWRLAETECGILPPVPQLGRHRSGSPLDLLLLRCTKRPLLQAGLEAEDLQTDVWVAFRMWYGIDGNQAACPPSDPRHIAHNHYLETRAKELLTAPASVDFRAERAAGKRHKP